MKKLLVFLALASAACAPGRAAEPEAARWERRARNVTIVRDDWGIAHVYGETDADAVFGLVYAQAEDDFNRVETNYLNALGRLAEAEGEDEIWSDLRMKLFIRPEVLQAEYRASPQWLRTLMDAFADGLNFFLSTHPDVQPRVLHRFEPWMALAFTEGSIGGDIERISLPDLEAFYGDGTAAAGRDEATDPGDAAPEPSGSNGIAIAPSRTAGGHALLLINPHTSFFFRDEVHAVSEEGLDAYGAVTWGQFFVYQGFNEHAGWMHTSSGVDNIDEYLETVEEREGELVYAWGEEERPVERERVTVPYRTPDGGRAERAFTVYRTHHGPVVRAVGDRWVSVRLMQEHVKALTQSWLRTKARDYEAFRRTMELHTNSSNNTVYADADGDIAYFHANFIPERDPRFDWTRPVDGSDPDTEWGPPMSIDETPGVLNPSVGWIQNTNNWPFSVAGPDSPHREDYPAYVETGGENARGLHAMRVLEGHDGFTLDGLVQAAFDPYLTAFENLVPSLVRAWDGAPTSDSLRARLSGPVAELRRWDLRWSVSSVPTTLAVYWGEELARRVGEEARRAGVPVLDWMAAGAPDRARLEALATAVERLEADFGDWRTSWGEVNRFQRLTGAIVQDFDDDAPSDPVGFTSSRWGSLASFGARTYPGTKRRYGTSGNSFVAVVEFGDSVRARAVTAGGVSGDPASPHFVDQVGRYATGELREVYFYRDDLEGHVEREYHPGG